MQIDKVKLEEKILETRAKYEEAKRADLAYPMIYHASVWCALLAIEDCLVEDERCQ